MCVFKTNCVACKTGTQFSYNITVNFILKNWLYCYLQASQYEDPWFNPRCVHVIFALGKVALGQDFLRVLRLYPVSLNYVNLYETSQSSSTILCISPLPNIYEFYGKCIIHERNGPPICTAKSG
jgi:hypothetical protein